MNGAARQVDHVVIEAEDETAVFELFTATFGLPVAWPLAQWGLIREGGVCVGDTNLGCNHFLDPTTDPRPTIRALALEPRGGFETVLPELDRRGITYSDPFASPADLDVPDDPLVQPWAEGWTNRIVFGWRDGVPLAFLCSYHHDTDARRARDVERLQAVDGGVLGVTRIKEVLVESADISADIEGWRNLLGPSEEPEPLLSIGRGPDIRLVAGAEDRYKALLFEVRSVDRAVAALDALGFSHERGADELRIDPADTLGCELRLTSTGTR